MNILKRVFHAFFCRLSHLIGIILNVFYYYPYDDAIIVNAWVKVRKGKVVPRNWGDDINVFLIELITGQKVIVRNQSLLHMIKCGNNYICIGTILGLYENKKAIIWGSGGIESNCNLKNKNVRVCSVRGMKTRNILLNQNVSCPSIYGDPALLISKYYQPNVKKKYKLGIIPHYTELNNEYLISYIKQNPDTLLINLSNYNDWLEIVDQINSCNLIISSSLHGLIVSDSYSIPNVWVRFSENIGGGDFKYLDYFSSVGRSNTTPYEILSVDDISNLLKKHIISNNIVIDYEAIANSCPFKLKPFIK